MNRKEICCCSDLTNRRCTICSQKTALKRTGCILQVTPLNRCWKSINIEEADNVNNNILDEVERAKHYFIKNYNKRIVKCTPMQFILNLRIEKAKELLEFGNYNISQVASMVGYDNPLYFSRLFKKYVGVSPKEYKKK